MDRRAQTGAREYGREVALRRENSFRTHQQNGRLVVCVDHGGNAGCDAGKSLSACRHRCRTQSARDALRRTAVREPKTAAPSVEKGKPLEQGTGTTHEGREELAKDEKQAGPVAFSYRLSAL